VFRNPTLHLGSQTGPSAQRLTRQWINQCSVHHFLISAANTVFRNPLWRRSAQEVHWRGRCIAINLIRANSVTPERGRALVLATDRAPPTECPTLQTAASITSRWTVGNRAPSWIPTENELLDDTRGYANKQVGSLIDFFHIIFWHRMQRHGLEKGIYLNTVRSCNSSGPWPT
jgi:hypothetical protein